MRRSALAAGGLALVLALSACSSSTGGTAVPLGMGATTSKPGSASLFSDPLQLVAAAKAGTQKSKSSKFTMDMTVAGMSIKASGQGKYDGANTAMSMSMDMLGQQMEMRLIGQTIYLKLPDSARASTGSTKPWTKVSLTDTSPTGKALSDNYNQLAEQNDPSKMLEQIQKAGTITKSEATTLNGEAANHYTVDIDFAKLADQMPAGLPADAKTQLAGKNVHFPMDLWLNADQLPMQIVMDMSALGAALGGAQAGQLGDMKMTMNYTDWGAPVDIAAPPAAEVGEAK
jgi:hypothetical protein